MSLPRPVVVGSKYNLLTILKEIPPHVQPNGRERRKVLCSCDCGNTAEVMLENLYAGYSKSCGCEQERSRFVHGMSKTAFRECHVNMKARCDNENHPSYPNYGARGITYCDKWATMLGFMEDMLEGYSDGMSIDRVDVNGDYCKENCRWTDMGVQGHNKRKKEGCLFEEKGVHLNINQTRYVAQICTRGESFYLATFDSLADAAKAYDDASLNMFGDRPNSTKECGDWIERIVHAKMKQKGIFKESLAA